MITEDEKEIIQHFAMGEIHLRKDAIEIHRRNLPDNQTPEMLFMSEIDNPCPDLILRARYRDEICKKFMKRITNKKDL